MCPTQDGDANADKEAALAALDSSASEDGEKCKREIGAVTWNIRGSVKFGKTAAKVREILGACQVSGTAPNHEQSVQLSVEVTQCIELTTARSAQDVFEGLRIINVNEAM